MPQLRILTLNENEKFLISPNVSNKALCSMKSQHGTLRLWLCALGWISFIFCIGSRMMSYSVIPTVMARISPNLTVKSSGNDSSDSIQIEYEAESVSTITMRWSPNIAFCDWNKMVFGSHHKTGTFLMFHVRDRMKELYAHHCCADGRAPDQSLIPHQTGRLSKELILKVIAENNAKDENEENIYILNVVRHPVDTVLSGYNCHLNTVRSLLFIFLMESQALTLSLSLYLSECR